MEPRFLDYYNRELAYIREMGKEFADNYPKIAGRLGMNGIEVADPYVERLLEGFSFLTARIHMKMDAEFPQFSQRLLEVVYPNYLAPTPSMAIAQISPSMNEGSLAKGFVLPKGTIMRGKTPKTEPTACDFATGHKVTLWPLEVASAELSGVPPDLPLKRMNLNTRNQPVRSSLRIRLEIKGGVKLHDFKLDQLVFHLNGQDIHMQRLLELVMGHTITVLCHDVDKPVSWVNRINVNDIRHEGFEADQALLPAESRIFQGYRIIQEYFAFPARFMFFSVNNMQKALKLPPDVAERSRNAPPGKEARAFELTFLFDKDMPELEGNITAENLALHCTPVINLFPKNADRINIAPNIHEYHLVVDRVRPLDYEVYNAGRIMGFSNDSAQSEKEFRPFFGSLGSDTDDYGAYYSLRREPRLMSDIASRNGARTGYIGSEVFISLVDKHQAPFSEDLRHLSLNVLCTNRDLPMLMPVGQQDDLMLRISAPIGGIRVLRGPSRPRPALAQGAYAWHLISHLGLNYLSLIDLDTEKGAQTLREMLKIYANIADPAVARQINGVRHVRVEPVHHRLPVPGPIVFGRGARIHLEVDEGAFSGVSPYLFGAVLEQFFARHVSINMMSELVLSTLQHGELARWKPRMGSRPAV